MTMGGSQDAGGPHTETLELSLSCSLRILHNGQGSFHIQQLQGDVQQGGLPLESHLLNLLQAEAWRAAVQHCVSSQH